MCDRYLRLSSYFFLQAIVELLREQLVVVQSASNSVHRAARPRPFASYQSPSVNLLEMSDINEVTTIAIEQGRLAMEAVCKTEDPHSRQKVKITNFLFLPLIIFF